MTLYIRFSATSSWIRLSVNPEKAVFEYEVKFEPQVDARNLRFHLLGTQREKLGSVKSFDGVMLWLPAHLPSEVSFLTSAGDYLLCGNGQHAIMSWQMLGDAFHLISQSLIFRDTIPFLVVNLKRDLHWDGS